VDNSTAGHLGCADRALASATGSLLLERLAAGTGNFTTAKRVVRSLASGSELRDNDLVDERNVGLNVEQVVGELNASRLLALDIQYVD
jgi:hypothetical protein